MVSEIENIQKGLVVATVEDNVNKRIIGIGSSTVTPDPVTGIAPLSKQNAFTKEQVESVQQAAEKVLGFEPGVSAVPAIEPAPEQVNPQTNMMPSIAPIEQSIQTAASPLPEPKVNDLITEEPMKVDIPAELGSIPSTKPLIEPLKDVIAPIAEPITTMVNQSAQQPVPTFEPISEPQSKEEVIATEPTGINEGMFATNNEPVPEVPNPTMPESVQPLPFESKPIQEEKPVELSQEPIKPEPLKTEEQELTLSQDQMEQIAKKISNLVYREVIELLNGMTKKQEQVVEEKIDSTDNLENPVLQTPVEYEEKPMTMKL